MGNKKSGSWKTKADRGSIKLILLVEVVEDCMLMERFCRAVMLLVLKLWA